jgi:hypothetical protein
MGQLAQRIHNGHAHQQGDPKAVALAPSSKDLNTARHAEDAAKYHDKYGLMYNTRHEKPARLPKTAVLWQQSLKEDYNREQLAAMQVGLGAATSWPREQLVL